MHGPMNDLDLIRMGREAGVPDWWMGVGLNGEVCGRNLQWLRSFATLVTSATLGHCQEVEIPQHLGDSHA